MSRLFGTDGVRGIANSTLTCELAMQIGAAGASVLTSQVHRPRILLGMDTRLSGDMLAAAMAAGICSVGADVLLCGVLPTPVLAYLVRLYRADAAVMISASHNSMEYNGIKWFDGKGFKLSDALEDEIQYLIENDAKPVRPTGAQVGHIIRMRRAKDDYIHFLREKTVESFEGFKIVLDCANGAAAGLAPRLFRELGAEVYAFADEPDGTNINDRCGSTYPARLQELMNEQDADVGFAFDGDADRMIAVDEHGNIVDGDRIMGICALAMRAAGTLKDNTLVTTVMSNLGLKKAMQAAGIAVEETQVGDRYVLERMQQNGLNLGGEQSGHVIFLDENTTGDGILSAIQLMKIIKKSGQRLSALAKQIPIYPQVLVNVIVDGDRMAAAQDPVLKARIEQVEAEMQGFGRVLVRPSGTEALVRIMLEGQEDEEKLRMYAVSMADILKEKYGGRIKS